MDLLLKLRKELKAQASNVKAPQMQAYMKSEMPYHGVPSPELKKICKNLFAGVTFKDQKAWEKAVWDLWSKAKFREERYAALNLAGLKKFNEYQNPKAMKLYEKLIRSGAWWDYVDDIASHRVGYILKHYPAPMKKLMLQWSNSPNLWIRRTSILSQLGFKKETDLPLLYACIEPSMDSKEFFLRKAIGWALRQHAWSDAKEIRRYVTVNKKRLSPLSQREALKNIVI